MISSILIGAVLELIGAIIMIYNLAEKDFSDGWWIWAIFGFVIMVAGFILLYAAFRPVEM